MGSAAPAAVVPPLGFVLSNAALAGDALKPKTM